MQISKTYTHYAATALFFFFGGRMLYEAVTNAHAGENELDEVEKELEVRGKASLQACLLWGSSKIEELRLADAGGAICKGTLLP